MNDYSQLTPVRGNYWRIPGTIVWSLILFAVFSLAQTVGALGAAVDLSQGTPTQEELMAMAPELAKDGNVLTIATLIGFIVTVPLMLLVIKLKRGSIISDYLALHRTTLRNYIQWIAIMAVAVTVMGAIGEMIQEKSADEFTSGVFNSASNPFMLFVAVAILAPVFEELFFRGFLYKGLAEGIVGPIGAILITSALWSIIHLQYDWYPILMIFVMGVILGLARWKTNSIWPPIVMHALNNAFSLIVVAYETTK